MYVFSWSKFDSITVLLFETWVRWIIICWKKEREKNAGQQSLQKIRFGTIELSTRLPEF